jgi:hypothetical protein
MGIASLNPSYGLTFDLGLAQNGAAKHQPRYSSGSVVNSSG